MEEHILFMSAVEMWRLCGNLNIFKNDRTHA